MSKPVILKHICSVEACINILKTGQFRPCSSNPLNEDSGINCFILGKKYNEDQNFEGTGACIYIEWSGPVVEVEWIGLFERSHKFPLKPNILYNFKLWNYKDQYFRAFIPYGTKKELIKVIDFEIYEERKEFSQEIRKLKERLKSGPIFLEIL